VQLFGAVRAAVTRDPDKFPGESETVALPGGRSGDELR
jgi:hypothetical protein